MGKSESQAICPCRPFCFVCTYPYHISASGMLAGIDPIGAGHRPGGPGLRDGCSDVRDDEAGGEADVQ